MMAANRFTRGLALGCAALTLCGCVSAGQISRRSVDYNAAVEAARSEMLLLNVLRARDRRLMVFTGLTRVTGSLRAEGRVGATGTAQDPEKASIGPSYGFSDSPSFDVAVLDSQEFTRGIMTPLSFDLIEYFWDQGFVREILLLMTTERIEVECSANQPLKLLENDPRDPTFGTFRQTLDAISDSGLWELDDHLNEEVGPPVETSEAAKLGTLIQIANGRLRVASRKDGRFQLIRPVERLRLLATGFDPCAGPYGVAVPEARLAFYDSRRAFETATPDSRSGHRARLVVRSPQSVVFYLGEMARPGREVVIRPRQPGQSEPERRLFVVREEKRCSDGLVGASYEGKRYVIPRGKNECDPGRSMQSLALAAQLLSLQQSARDLPASGTVRVIGQ